MNFTINSVAFAVLTLLWLAFGAAMVISPGSLTDAWQAFRGFPPVLQLVVVLHSRGAVLVEQRGHHETHS